MGWFNHQLVYVTVCLPFTPFFCTPFEPKDSPTLGQDQLRIQRSLQKMLGSKRGMGGASNMSSDVNTDDKILDLENEDAWGILVRLDGFILGQWLNWLNFKLFGIIYSRWWFQIFFIFTPTWGRFPFWLIFFRWVETTNQYLVGNIEFKVLFQGPLVKRGFVGFFQWWKTWFGREVSAGEMAKFSNLGSVKEVTKTDMRPSVRDILRDNLLEIYGDLLETICCDIYVNHCTSKIFFFSSPLAHRFVQWKFV